MADKGYVRAVLSAIADDVTKRVTIQAFEHTLDNLRLGAPSHQTRATNFQAYWVNSTTPATANEEFSIAHGLPSIPQYAIPVLELDKPGAKVVPLEVARAADAKRIYLKSTSTSAPILLLIEA